VGDLSQHFSRSEFDCPHCGAGCPSPQLVAILERLRGIVGGKPLSIVSGFRCVPHNAAVGGAQHSRHPNGDAADIPSGYATTSQAAQAGAVGIGSKGQWALHVDWRPGGAARWTY
jgi:uncharacterized protein YcbK (DUF882 family)